MGKRKEKRLYRRTQIPAAIRADGWNDFSANEQKKKNNKKLVNENGQEEEEETRTT